MSNDSKDELTLRIGEKLTAARIESGYTQSRAAIHKAVRLEQSAPASLAYQPLNTAKSRTSILSLLL